MTYTLGFKPRSYVVRVSDTGRGRKTIEKREFTDYDKAILCHTLMEETYGHKYIVEFDTKFK